MFGAALYLTVVGVMGVGLGFLIRSTAGGIALTYWALRKAGMPRGDVGRRMVAFLTLHYAFYPIALIVFGILLRTGVVNGEGSVELTIVPAAVAGLLIALGVLLALIPTDLSKRIAPLARGHGELVSVLGNVSQQIRGNE